MVQHKFIMILSFSTQNVQLSNVQLSHVHVTLENYTYIAIMKVGAKLVLPTV